VKLISPVGWCFEGRRSLDGMPEIQRSPVFCGQNRDERIDGSAAVNGGAETAGSRACR